jgi:hypothetical protein
MCLSLIEIMGVASEASQSASCRRAANWRPPILPGLIDKVCTQTLNEPVAGAGLMNSRLVWIVLPVAGVTAVLIAVQPPVWLWVLLGSMAFAVLYIVARLNSRYDPLDPRFGSCIPPISKPGDQ